MNQAQLSQFREIRTMTVLATVQPTESDTPGYKMHNGFFIKVEHPAGSTRTGIGSDGQAWATQMQNDYGELPGSLGSDGDPVDAYLGPNTNAKIVHVIHMNDDAGNYDEDKAMIGFNSQQDAIKAFKAHYPEGSAKIGSITSMKRKAFASKVRLSKLAKNKGATAGQKFHAGTP